MRSLCAFCYLLSTHEKSQLNGFCVSRKAFLSRLVLNFCEDVSEVSPALGVGGWGVGGLLYFSCLLAVKLGSPVM